MDDYYVPIDYELLTQIYGEKVSSKFKSWRISNFLDWNSYLLANRVEPKIQTIFFVGDSNLGSHRETSNIWKNIGRGDLYYYAYFATPMVSLDQLDIFWV